MKKSIIRLSLASALFMEACNGLGNTHNVNGINFPAVSNIVSNAKTYVGQLTSHLVSNVNTYAMNIKSAAPEMWQQYVVGHKRAAISVAVAGVTAVSYMAYNAYYKKRNTSSWTPECVKNFIKNYFPTCLGGDSDTN